MNSPEASTSVLDRELRLRHWLLLAIAAAWALRALVISVSPWFGWDERYAFEAAQYPVASRFVSELSMPAKWQEVRRLSTGDRPLWPLWNLLCGYLVPSDGSAALLLSVLASAVTLLALYSAARRFAGSALAGVFATIMSLSPLAFHYSTSILAPALSTMWIALAILAFSSRRWKWGEWMLGGLCLGLAFGTHMGAGAPILGLACGLASSIVTAFRAPNLGRRERLRRLLLCPLAGLVAAITPLLLLESWARASGDSYFKRLLHHENLNLSGVGPFGLWIRELFELDPIFEVLVVALLLAALRSPQPSRRRKGAIGASLLAGILLLSLRDSPQRAIVSLLIFGGLGALMAPSGHFGSDPPRSESNGSSPLTAKAIFVAAAATTIIFTVWRSVSGVPRATFPGWPLLALALSGEVLRRIPRSRARPLALLAAVLALLGAYAVLRARNIPARSAAAAARRPGWVKLTYENFWYYEDRVRAAGWIETRASFDVEAIRPPEQMYPVWTYEEEPYKQLFFRDLVRDFRLDGVFSAIEAPWTVVYFDPGPTVPPAVVAAGHPLSASP